MFFFFLSLCACRSSRPSFRRFVNYPHTLSLFRVLPPLLLLPFTPSPPLFVSRFRPHYVRPCKQLFFVKTRGGPSCAAPWLSLPFFRQTVSRDLFPLSTGRGRRPYHLTPPPTSTPSCFLRFSALLRMICAGFDARPPPCSTVARLFPQRFPFRRYSPAQDCANLPLYVEGFPLVCEVLFFHAPSDPRSRFFFWVHLSSSFLAAVDF